MELIKFGLEFEPIIGDSLKAFDALSGEFKSFGASITDVSAALSQLEKDLKQLQTFKELQDQLSLLVEEEKKLSTRKEELQKRYRGLTEELNKLQKEYREGKISTEEYQKAEDKLKSELSEVENEIGNLKNILNSLQAEKRETENRAKSLAEELEKLGYSTKEVDRWIEQLEKELNELQKEGKETGDTFSGLSEKLKSLASIGISGVTFGSIVKDVVDAEGAARKIVANTTLGWEKVAKLQRDILDLYKETGASQEEIEQTIKNIIQQTGKWDEETKKAAETALKLAQITGGKYEPTELIHAAMQIKKSFKDVSSLDEALQHIYTILQNAGDVSGDLLDVLREYSPLLAESGLKAKEFAGALIAGAKAGAFNYDKIADTLKEAFKAGLAEGTNLQDLMQKLNNLQKEYGDLISENFSEKQWVALKSAFVDYINAVKNGDKELQKKSFIRITTLFAEAYKKNKLVAKELMQEIFGTIGTEDLAVKVVEAIAKGIEQQKEFYQNAKSIDESYQNMLSTWERLERAVIAVKTELAVALAPIVDKLVWGLEKVADFVSEHSTLTAAVVGTAGALITLGGAVKLLGSAFGLVKSGLGALLSPLGVFKKELSTSCAQASCISGLKNEFKGLGGVIEKVKGKLTRFRALLSKPLALGNELLSTKGGFLAKLGGALGKTGGLFRRIGLKGLARVGLNFLGPVGWAISAGLMAWDAWSLLNDTGIGKAIAHRVGKAWEGIKSVGSSILGGIRSLFGLGEEHKTAKPVAEKDSLIHKVAEVAKVAVPISGAAALVHKVGGWLSHLFGDGEKKEEPPKEVRHFEKVHKEVVSKATELQKADGSKEGTFQVEIKPNITFNVSVSSTEPQRIKEEILQTLQKLTPDLLDWLERALEELRHRNAPVY